MFFLVIAVYAVCIFHLFVYWGPKVPAVFIALWILGFLEADRYGPSSDMAFIAYQAILCVVMQLLLKFRNPGYRR